MVVTKHISAVNLNGKLLGKVAQTTENFLTEVHLVSLCSNTKRFKSTLIIKYGSWHKINVKALLHKSMSCIIVLQDSSLGSMITNLWSLGFNPKPSSYGTCSCSRFSVMTYKSHSILITKVKNLQTKLLQKTSYYINPSTTLSYSKNILLVQWSNISYATKFS
jgi:hypothetical protein